MPKNLRGCNHSVGVSCDSFDIVFVSLIYLAKICEDEMAENVDSPEISSAGSVDDDFVNNWKNERTLREKEISSEVKSQLQNECEAFGGQTQASKRWEEAAKMIAYQRAKEKEGTEKNESKRDKLLQEQKKLKDEWLREEMEKKRQLEQLRQAEKSKAKVEADKLVSLEMQRRRETEAAKQQESQEVFAKEQERRLQEEAKKTAEEQK